MLVKKINLLCKEKNHLWNNQSIKYNYAKVEKETEKLSTMKKFTENKDPELTGCCLWNTQSIKYNYAKVEKDAEKLSDQEEIHWKQRSRGYRNTKYFHTYIGAKQTILEDRGI